MATTTTPAIDRLAAVLAEADRPLTQAELALAAGVGRSTATSLLTRLTAGDVRRIDNGPKASSTYATLALLATLAEAAAQEDAEVMGAEAAAAMDEPELTAAELAAGPDSDTRHREAMSASGVPVAVLPHGGAAIPTADMMRNGLIRGTWKQLGAVLGDTVEVLTPNQERLVGELATSGGVCFLVVEGGRQVSLGGWATRQYGRLVSKRPVAAAAAPAATGSVPAHNGKALALATPKAHGMAAGDRVALYVEGEVREGVLERNAAALYSLRVGALTYPVGGGQRPVYAVMVEADAVAAAAVERPAEVANFNGLPRLARGELRAQVVAWLEEHPEGEITPVGMGKALGGRNSSACNGVLRVLTEEGVTEQTSAAPKRFRLAAAE